MSQLAGQPHAHASRGRGANVALDELARSGRTLEELYLGGGTDGRSEQLTNVFAWGELFGALFASLLGAISITGQFRHGTIRSTLLITPRRERVIVAKIGALVRHQVPAIAGICIWLLFIENLLVAFVPDAGRLGPGAAGGALAGSNPERLLAPAVGAGILALYAAVATATGWLATTRRDAA
jgi:hypothetical protein